MKRSRTPPTAYAGGIYEAQQDAAHYAGLLDRVARGSGDVRDKGPVVPQQGVQQRTLAAVWCAHDRHGDAVAYGIARLERVGKRGAAPDHLVQQRCKPVPVGKFHLFLAEVEFQFDERGEFKEFRTDFGKFGGITAAQLVQGDPVLRLRARCDEVGYRLGLCEVHFPVRKRPAGELSGPGHSAAGFAEQPEYAACYERGGVAAYLRGILARIGMRGAVDAHHDFVDAGDVPVLESISARIGGTSLVEAHDPVDGAKAVGTAYPYHADRPGADRSRGSTDSVCRIIHKTVCFVPSRR